ncbi:GIN domain-containing protein [Flavobacterium psychrophilum]|uniref:GIN domain-containing protein n=1 Tax=Flavobacterium psychrophilum TaxID=96345 RepID=UPI0039854923
MKKINLLIFAVLFTTITFAQKKEKVKGSKIVTIEKIEVSAFTELEIEDNLEVFLVKGDKNALEIETDENLHTAINHQTYGNSLRLNTNKEISGFKKLEIRVTYTDSLKLISVKHEAKLNAVSDIVLKGITIKTYDYSKTVISANTPNFTLLANDKSKVELNLKSEEAFIEMSKNAAIKAKISSNKLKFDLYQKSEAVVEGNTNEMKLRLDSNATYEGKMMTSKTLDLTTESNTKCSVYTNGNLAITATGKSEISVFGEPKIELKKFADQSDFV